MIKLTDLLKELKEDVGEFLFGDPKNWNDPSMHIAYRSQFDQKEEPDTEEESMVLDLLQRWKMATSGQYSNNAKVHKALVQIAKDPKFDNITKSHYSTMFRCASFTPSKIIEFAKTTKSSNWKDAVDNMPLFTNAREDVFSYHEDMSICTKLYPYRPTSLITSWSTNLDAAMNFISTRDPIIYIQSIKKLLPGDSIFTGGDSYENSFDAISNDNSGEGEILGLKKEFNVNIAIPKSYVEKLIRLNVIRTSA